MLRSCSQEHYVGNETVFSQPERIGAKLGADEG